MNFKRIFSCILTATIMLGVLIPLFSVGISAAGTYLKSDKTVYSVGDPIYITASSDNTSGKDWIGIAPAHMQYAMRWEYLSDVGNGTQIDARELKVVASGQDFTYYQNFPAGDYVIYFISNDKAIGEAIATSSVIGKIDITIVNGDPSEYANNATYKLDDAKSGFADGVLNINLPNGSNPTDIYMWWGDDTGKLEGYTMLAKFKVPNSLRSFSYRMTPNTIIPKGATKLLVYTYSSSAGLSHAPFECKLPKDIQYIDTSSKANIEFEVMSDLHIQETDTTNNQNFAKALNDIAENSLDSEGIFVVGNMVDYGANSKQWANLWNIYDNVNNTKGLSHMYFALGNRDRWGFDTNYSTVVSNFLANLRMPNGVAKPTTAYYEVWIGKYQFLFLATSEITSDAYHAIIGDAQYKWLEQKLKSNKTDNPIFIFMNQSLENTVSGSSTAEGWWGIEDGDKLRELIKEYPQICMFNGLTQWTLDDKNTMYKSDGEGAIFNTAAVCGLWHSYNKVEGEGFAGSQGYYLKVYDDRILVLGRDFTTGEWVSSAQFAIMKPQQNEEVNNNVEQDTDNTVETDAIETQIGTDQPDIETQLQASDISTDTGNVVPTPSKGCKATFVAPITAIALAGGAILTTRKKRK